MTKNVRTLLLMLASLALCSSSFVPLLRLPGIMQLNTSLFEWINHFYWPALANLTAPIEQPADLFGILFVLILLFFKRYDLALCILIAIAIEIVYVTWMKDLIAIAHPFIVLNGINVAYYPGDFSFPSGHATGAFAVFSTWCFRDRKNYFPLLCFAALIAFSRVYIGVHRGTSGYTIHWT